MNGRAVNPGGRESGAGSTPASQIAARIAVRRVASGGSPLTVTA